MTTPPEGTDEDATISVARNRDDGSLDDVGDQTVAVVREPTVTDDDATVAVRSRGPEQGDGAGDETIAVTRAPFSPPDAEGASDTTVGLGRTGRGSRLAQPDPRHRRRGIKPPPVPAGFAPLPVEGLGPWGVEEYEARTLSPPPPSTDHGPAAVAARVEDPALRSVKRHARRSGRRAVVAFVVSCAVFLAAIVTLTLWLTGVIPT